MTRKEQIGLATLYCGDCREVMRDAVPPPEYHAVITDPVWPDVPEGLFDGVDPWSLMADMVGHLPRFSVRQLVVVLRNTSDPRFLGCVPKHLPFQQVAWLQYVMTGYLGRVLGGNECAYVFGEPVKVQPGRRVIPSVSPKAQPSDRPPNGHPCSRALVHMRWLVNWFSDYGETVFDPFMGSGTTGVAAVEHGRDFVGVEVDERYFDIACERIREGQQQGRLFA